jgi:hypothetical protein
MIPPAEGPAVNGVQIGHHSSIQNDATGITADSTTSNNTISYNKASGNGTFDCEDDSVGAGQPARPTSGSRTPV